MLPATARQAVENFIKGRPNIKLPDHLKDLDGTHGLFIGDGKKEREIKLGWKPTFVIFVVPVYPDGDLPRVMNIKNPTDSYYRPELHPQPVYTETGFKVGELLNKAGVTHVFVAWKAPKK